MSDDLPAEALDPPPPFSPWMLLYPQVSLDWPLSLLYLGFWIWMLVHCVRNDPDRSNWLWLLIFLPGIGPAVYFLARVLPAARGSLPAFTVLKRLTMGRQLARLEHAARNIGNAHQWVELGELQRELGQIQESAQSFRRALQKDANYLPALWGAAQSELALKNLPEARQYLHTILARDFTYKFGDVSLAYGRTLVKLNDREGARAHLASHLQRWTHPEAQVLLARLLIDAGEPDQARQHLETLQADLAAAPVFFARQNRRWGSQARSLLKTLRASPASKAS